MNESLIQQYQMSDDGSLSCKALSLKKIMTLFRCNQSWQILVPAAAVRRVGQALFGITRRKGFVDCKISFLSNFKT